MKKTKKVEAEAPEEVTEEVVVLKVATLDTPFGNGELEILRAKLNEVIAKL